MDVHENSGNVSASDSPDENHRQSLTPTMRIVQNHSLAIYGYVREVSSKFKHLILPTAIIDVMFKFYYIAFPDFPQPEGSTFCISKQGWSSDIHEFKIKILNKTSKSASIGIMSYCEKIFELPRMKWCFDDALCHISYQLFSLCDEYSTLSELCGFYRHEKGVNTMYKVSKTPKKYYQQGDIVSLQVNFDTMKIEFFINGETVNDTAYDIMPAITYYPAFASWDIRNNESKYEILTCS
eukprot:354396_1